MICDSNHDYDNEFTLMNILKQESFLTDSSSPQNTQRISVLLSILGKSAEVHF